MSENIKSIAQRLRELRDIGEKTPQDAAAAFGLPVEVYEKYESGEQDIPVSFLYEAAQYFGVELIELLSGDAPKLRIYQFVPAGKGLPVERSKQYKYQSLAHNFSHKKAEPFLVSVQPCQAEIHTNVHHGQEFNYCLEGEMLIHINGQDITLRPGDCIYYDSSYPHGMKALGDKEAKFLAVIF